MTRLLPPSIALIALGCASSAAVEGPETVLHAYIAAVRAGDAAAVHALLDSATQTEVPQEQIATLLTENREELASQLSVIEDAARSGVESRAEVPLESEEQVVLHLEEGRWMIGGGVLDAPALQTPRDAVMSLRHALKRRSMPGLLRVLARVPRAELEAQIEEFLGETEDALDLETEVQGNMARVRLSSGRVVLLTREAGEWRIVDIE